MLTKTFPKISSSFVTVLLCLSVNAPRSIFPKMLLCFHFISKFLGSYLRHKIQPHNLSILTLTMGREGQHQFNFAENTLL
jgi:hypothetical protein